MTADLRIPRSLRFALAAYMWCGILNFDRGAGGILCCFLTTFGDILVGVVPWMWSAGTVSANVGGLWARTCVTASNPEANLINIGSLNAVPKKLTPRGAPNTVPAGT